MTTKIADKPTHVERISAAIEMIRDGESDELFGIRGALNSGGSVRLEIAYGDGEMVAYSFGVEVVRRREERRVSTNKIPRFWDY